MKTENYNGYWLVQYLSKRRNCTEELYSTMVFYDFPEEEEAERVCRKACEDDKLDFVKIF